MSLHSNTNAKTISKQNALLNKNLRKVASFLTTFCALKLSIKIGFCLIFWLIKRKGKALIYGVCTMMKLGFA